MHNVSLHKMFMELGGVVKQQLTPTDRMCTKTCVFMCVCVDLLAQLVPGKIEGPELRALPLIRGGQRRDEIPTQSQRDNSLVGE